MKLNAAETLLMNNPIRALVQRRFEGPLLRKLGGTVAGARVLEIGCGRGTGIPILSRQFGAAEIFAIDFDPMQIRRALRRLHGSTVASLAVASADRLPFPSASFDAVFDFGILHHIPAWQQAVAEVRRVLKPAGRFFFEEVTRSALESWPYRTFLRHPKEDRFSESDFLAELHAQGIVPLQAPVRIWGGDFFIGVGQAEQSLPAGVLSIKWE